MKAVRSTDHNLAVSRISGLVLTNALIFQEILSEHDPRVHSLQKLLGESNPTRAFSEHWDYILAEINYYPIFHVARELLVTLGSKAEIVGAVCKLATTAQEVVGMRAALRHDLMGRVYHRLLTDAKYLGTYYTGIPAAALLLKLATRRLAVDWGTIEAVSALRVADLASGTGTLLMAAADAITDLHIRERMRTETAPDTTAIHRSLLETVLHGYDVLETAIHLTASTLALRAPEVGFRRMRLFTLPLGGRDRRLGSIEFLARREILMYQDLFGSVSTAAQVAESDDTESFASLPELDLCVMNPPFVRSVGGNLLFGSMPEAERTEMQKRLARLLRETEALANTTAGLGSVFVAVGDRALKDGGRLALVLPKAVLSGVAWGKTRALLRQKYELEYIVASHDPLQWNFSESTQLSEVLIVARKANRKTARPEALVTAVNLTRNPSNTFEAFAVEACLRGSAPDVASGQGALDIRVGEQAFGEAVALPWNELKDQELWILPCAFAQADLIRTAFNLLRGDLWLPGEGIVGVIPTCALGELGRLGPDRRDIHDGFRLADTATSFPAFWGHDAANVTTVAQSPNRYLSPLSRAKPGRSLRRVEVLWPLAGRLMIAERMWLTTARVTAVRLADPALSNTWWSFSASGRGASQEEKRLAMWFNSTLGIISLLANRAETRGAWIDFKKPVLERLRVPDFRGLAAASQKALASAFTDLSDEPLLALPSIADDKVRARIDAAITEALGLPDLSRLRTLLGREPVVCLRRL